MSLSLPFLWIMLHGVDLFTYGRQTFGSKPPPAERRSTPYQFPTDGADKTNWTRNPLHSIDPYHMTDPYSASAPREAWPGVHIVRRYNERSTNPKELVMSTPTNENYGSLSEVPRRAMAGIDLVVNQSYWGGDS
eukprot:jgi/Bigna1/143613/aug1.80_g18321